MKIQPPADFLSEEMEQIIIKALRFYQDYADDISDEERKLADDYASALENDTTLMETSWSRSDCDV